MKGAGSGPFRVKFPVCAESGARQRQIVRRDLKERKKAGRLSWEGHSLFISILCCTEKISYSKIILFIFLVPLWRCCRYIVWTVDR